MNKVQCHQTIRLPHQHHHGVICSEPVRVHIRWPAVSTHCSMFCLMMLFAVLSIGENAHAQSNDWYIWEHETTSGPSPRYYHQMVYDTARSKAVLFGGSDPTNWPNIVYFDDIWEWDSATRTWTDVTPASGSAPAARYGHAMTYDSARQRVVLFGGWSPSGGLLADTWEWDGANGTWHGPFFGPANLVPRIHHGIAYDANRQQTVLFGGSTQPPHHFDDTGHTWEWDGGSWTQVAQSGIGSPSPRSNFGIAARHSGVVIYGGSDGANCYDQTWRWNGTGWFLEQDSSGPPSERIATRLAWDSVINRLVMYGGTGIGCVPGGGPLEDTLRRDTTSWITLFTIGTVPRFAHAMTFDETLNAMILHGGADDFGLHGDTRLGWPNIDNDEPQDAFPISDGTIHFNNTLATDGLPGCASERDLWYLYTATCNGVVRIQTSAFSPGLIPQVAVYRGTTPQHPLIDCSTGEILFQAAAGEEFLIRLGSVNGATGSGTLTLSCGDQCPPNITAGNFRQRKFRIIGSATGASWAWMIKTWDDHLAYDLNVPGIAPGSNPLQLAHAFVNNINTNACGTNKILALQPMWSPQYIGSAEFTVRVGGSAIFDMYVGPAGQIPGCRVTNFTWCAFNPQIIEIIPCLGDLDGDGHVNIQDLFELLGEWGTCPDPLDCPADLDGDGEVNVSDLFALLGNWGECESTAPPASCEGLCGGQHPDGCSCDKECCFFGDCCDDFHEGVCGFTCEFE